jgi:hypothetical protein
LFQTTAAKANEQTRKRSPFMFLVIGLCFFLPFISISCSGQRLGTLSGVQLVTGAEIDIDEQALTEQFGDLNGGTTGFSTFTSGDPDERPTEDNEPSVWAIIALAGAAIGVIVGFVTKGRMRAIGSLTAALLGLAGLIGLRLDLEGDLGEAKGLVSVDYRIGYWIAALLFAVLAIAHGTFLRATKSTGPPATGPPGPNP